MQVEIIIMQVEEIIIKLMQNLISSGNDILLCFVIAGISGIIAVIINWNKNFFPDIFISCISSFVISLVGIKILFEVFKMTLEPNLLWIFYFYLMGLVGMILYSTGLAKMVWTTIISQSKKLNSKKEVKE